MHAVYVLGRQVVLEEQAPLCLPTARMAYFYGCKRSIDIYSQEQDTNPVTMDSSMHKQWKEIGTDKHNQQQL